MTVPPSERDLADMALARSRAQPAVPRRRRTAPTSGGPTGGRDPQLVAGAIERLVAEQEWAEDLLAAGLMTRWAEVVGEDLAAHVVPEVFEPSTRRLVLRADSTAWATQVRLLLPSLRERIAEEIGPIGPVEVVGPAAPSWVHGPRHVRGRGPRDTYG